MDQKEERSALDHPAMDDLREALLALENAENLLKRAKEQITQAVIALPSRIGENEDLQDEIVSYLYWCEERIPALVLKEAFNVVSPAHASYKTTKAKGTKVLRYPSIEIICSQCHHPFLYKVTSRTARKERWRPSQCEECTSKHDQAYWQQQKRAEEYRQQRINELRSMPYYDYLQTEEWKERRSRALKRAWFRCQVCNAYGVRLNVHHRTYERRGDEHDKDLIVLCESCHQTFHESGKLARGN